MTEPLPYRPGMTVPLPGPLHWAAVVVMAAAIVMTVVTGMDYVWRAVRVRADGRRRQA